MTKEEACAVLDDMKVKIDIPHAAATQRKRNEALDMAISALKGFKGMTNGEVIQAMFPCTEVVEGDGITGVRIDTKDIGALMVLYTDWWNAPYQKGGE